LRSGNYTVEFVGLGNRHAIITGTLNRKPQWFQLNNIHNKLHENSVGFFGSWKEGPPAGYTHTHTHTHTHTNIWRSEIISSYFAF
jgi:hypothetical protein